MESSITKLSLLLLVAEKLSVKELKEIKKIRNEMESGKEKSFKNVFC